MDMIFEVISFIIAVIGIPASIDYYPRKFPIIKKGWYLITNNHYNVKIIGTKEYISFEYDLKTIKKVIHEKYSVYKINLLNKNSINVYLKNMPAPYKILFTPSYNETNKLYLIKVTISLEGDVKCSYRDKNNKYLNIESELFTIIEETYEITPSFKWFSLVAYTEDVTDKPLKKEMKLLTCEDTKIQIDKTSKYMKINSDSINNIIACLNSNIIQII